MTDTSAPEPGGRKTGRTRFVCVSDTHNRNVALPKGDVLIHAGDITNNGNYDELEKMVSWIEKADFGCKIVVGGNHDVSLDEALPTTSHQKSIALLATSPTITYLTHTPKTITLTSPTGPKTTFKAFGSPSSPARPGPASYFSAFQYPRDVEPRLWEEIPDGTDVLVTHAPPYTHRDRTEDGMNIGCEALRGALRRVRPRLAICGHVHAGRGAEHVAWGDGEDVVETWVDPAPEGRKNCLVDLRGRPDGETCVVNCAIMTGPHSAGGHKQVNKPIVVDVELPVWE